MKRTALVTGGNRGIGLEVCRRLAAEGHDVVLGARDVALGREAAARLAKRSLIVQVEELDVSRPASIDACIDRLGRAGIRIDMLVNNAGVYGGGALLSAAEHHVAEGFAVNVMGPLRLCQRLIPEMGRRGYGRVVNISSGLGAISDGLHGPEGVYSVTKAALNALTIRLAAEAPEGVKVNAACPGWVRTRMGTDAAPRSVEEGADTPVWLATLPADGPNGGFFRDRKPIAW
jgi:NAD(P)-dependent dehydrogenase (short-subunit alcohol dehydrogenase family)